MNFTNPILQLIIAVIAAVIAYALNEKFSPDATVKWLVQWVIYLALIYFVLKTVGPYFGLHI